LINEMLKIFGRTGAAAQENFDQLFVPFRCVASAVESKKSKTFVKREIKPSSQGFYDVSDVLKPNSH